jgi:hypothetical protein
MERHQPERPAAAISGLRVGGVWNWRGKRGKTVGPEGESRDVKGPIPDLDRIAWTDRRVVLFFDVDVLTNETVRYARNQLARELQDRGARVFLQQPPPEYGVKGVDDLLAAKGPELVLHLIEHAMPAKPRRRRVSMPGADSAAFGVPPAQYEATGGKLIWHKPSGDQLVPTPLANFDARIVAELIKDDGIEQTRFYEILATHNNSSYSFQVRATEFDSLNWIAKHLPAECTAYAGRGIKDHLPVAIKTVSGTILQRTIFVHTGWSIIRGQRAYLHADGAIGAGGVVPDVQVELPPELSEFRLPPPPESGELIDFIHASLTVLNTAPDRLSVPMLLTAYRAPLGEANFGVFDYGFSGERKSCEAALVQQHFGAAMDFDHLPANWQSTENYLERLAHLAKDTVLVIDDFVLQGDYRAVQRMHAVADRLFRGQANRQARGRLQSDTSFRVSYKPRGLLIGTGEDLPRGQSLRARLLALLFEKGDMKLKALAAAQQAAADQQFSRAMAGFIQYVAKHWDDIRGKRRAYAAAAKKEAAGVAEHGRSVAMRHELLWTAQILTEFAVNAGAMTDEDASEFRERVDKALREVAAERVQLEQDSDIAQRSLELLSAAITRGDAYLSDREGKAPEQLERYGWRKRQTSGGASNSFEWESRGSLIGWVNDEDHQIYLEPHAAFAAIQGVARATQEPFPVSRSAWARALDAKKLLEQRDTTRRVYTCRKTVQGQERPVLALKQSSLEAP